MIYGYARVSTKGQAKDGNSLEDQEMKLREAGAEQIVSDAFTGTKMDRPNFSKLREELQTGDTLVVTKLDRFARTIVEGVTVIRELMEKGVTVNILNMGVVQNTSTGRLTLSMMMAFAEFERDMIVERTQAGKAVARAKAEAEGKKFQEGRKKKYGPDKVEHAMELLDQGFSYTQVEKKLGISKSTLIRRRREQKAEEQNANEPKRIDYDYVPFNLNDAIWDTNKQVYSYLKNNPDYTKTLESELKEISELTEAMVEEETKTGRWKSRKRIMRDQKLDKLAEKVLKHMEE